MSNVIRLAAVVTSVLSAASAAGQPRIENGRMRSQPAGSSLAETVRTLTAAQTDLAWIGYSVPSVDGERVMCCFDSETRCGGCRLEPSASTAMISRSSLRS